MIQEQGEKTYYRDKCAIFLKTAEQFGGLSNMAGGFPLSINGIKVPTAEALYQACRFPHKPELQKIVIGQKSPMTAKMKTKPHRGDSREDWDSIRILVMDWCLHVKLAQHWEKFGSLLLSTQNKPIVEESYRDQFWGAKPVSANVLVGRNVLGQLLTALREHLKTSKSEELLTVRPPEISQFLLINLPIRAIKGVSSNSQPYTYPLLQKTIYDLADTKDNIFFEEKNVFDDREQNESVHDVSIDYSVKKVHDIVQLNLF